jgi:pyrroline-5-carboxylate reductase
VSTRLAILGAGVMGEAIATYALASGIVDRDRLTIVEQVAARRADVASRLGVRAAGVADALQDADVVVVAVKPQDFGALAAQVNARLRPEALAISIMAGVSLAKVTAGLGHSRVVRAAPNTPAQIGAGVTVWFAPQDVAAAARETVVRPLLAALGAEFEVPDEKYIDMAIAVNGSGPAFVFLAIEAMADAAVQIGFSRAMANELAIATFAGSAAYAQASKRHLAELRNQVTSPAGTTAAGLFELEAGGVRAAFARAVQAAYDRAKALGG